MLRSFYRAAHRNVKKMSGNFELKYKGEVNDVIPVYKYKSNKTGLSVVVAQVEGPLVNGYFCLATEAFDDDGLPHTLEHLVFMGSEDYPYKGVLDLLANRCLASGTNAWTDTDHTCYTMTTAGSEGFLNLMPIYLDHVLYPTLTESAYITEVHHINEEGEDAGVVYCEMQDVQNTGENLTRFALLKAMYPGHCGYKSETGGALENLRTSTSHEKVCKYHKEFYRPENLCLVITGQVQPQDVLLRLQSFEEKIISKGSLPPYKRPWQSPVPPVTETTEQVVKYPSDEEENGMVLIGWRGCQAKDQYDLTALMVLLEYLTDTAVAPLQRELVEVENPFCNDVSYNIIENAESMFYIKFKNVPKDKLKDIKDKLFELLGRFGEGVEKFDMSRMENVIHRRVLEAMDHLEDDPHDTVSFHIIGDFLYGDTNDDLETRLNPIKMFNKMKAESEAYWLNLLKSYTLGTKYACIVGEPSTALMEEMGKAEKERVQKQREALGKAGLKKKGEILENATDDNEEEPPEELLTSVDVPDVGCIHFHKIQSSSNVAGDTGQTQAKFPLQEIPVVFQLDDIQTNFVNLTVMMDTNDLDADLKRYLPLYSEVLLESPINRNGILVSHEDVISELEADTLHNDCSVGVSGGRFSVGKYGTQLVLNFKVEVDKYEKGVQWVQEILYQVEFTPERLNILASKMANDVASMKRKGTTVIKCLFRDMIYDKDSNECICSMMRQHKFLTRLLEDLEKPDKAKKIVNDMNEIRRQVTEVHRMRVHVSATVETLAKLTSPQQVWRKTFSLPGDHKPGKRQPVKQAHEYLLGESDGPGAALIIGVGSVESSFLIQCTPCVKGFDHPDIPAIYVFMQYMTQLEGPMWRQIRGLGLSYHYSMYLKEEEGLLYFILYRSTHIVNAYKEGKKIIESHLSGEEEFSDIEFEGCKSSLIFEVIEDEKTPSDASSLSMLSYLRGIPQDYSRQLIKKIPQVTLEDLKRVGPKYFRPLFDSSKSKVAICCHPTKVEEICSDMKEFSREFKVLNSLEESFLADIKVD